MTNSDERLEVFILPTCSIRESRDSIDFYTERFESGHYRTQRFSHTPYYAEKFEFLRDKRVVIFAGGPGDCADALRKLGARIVYSDLTAPIAKYAHETKDLDAVVADVMMLPFNLRKADYLLSYQPSVTSCPSQTLLMILQGLTTRRGLVIVDPIFGNIDAWEGPLHALYRCRFYKEKFTDQLFSKYYYRIENSYYTPKLALLDLELIRFVNSLGERRLKFFRLHKVFNKMGIDSEEGLKSVKRLDRMMVPLNFVKDHEWIEIENF